MRHLVYIFVCCILILSSCQTKLTKTVVIKVNAKKVEKNQSLYISGNHSLLGSWQPDSAKLAKIDDSTWSGSFEFNPEEILEFKFTKGGWDSEALTEKNSIPGNHHLTVLSDTTLNFSISKWSDTDPIISATIGQITGTAKYHTNISYDGLKDRNLIVWLPPGYEKNKKKRYPVLYMHDGQNIIDPKTSAFGIDWQIDETADSLINSGEIEPIIIVGIYNTADRSPEYSDTELGKKYVDLLINQIKPMIDEDYRTKPDRENTAIGGSSMGGLISFILAWNNSEVFSKAICMSPAFAYQNYNYVDKLKTLPKPKNDLILYIDNGGLGLEKILQPGIDQMFEYLTDYGFVMDKNLFWVLDENAEHNEPAWAARMYYPLKTFYGIR